jgi:ribulose-5-phosphate 4-epimerase/fuculose-1-phosphate aldolase
MKTVARKSNATRLRPASGPKLKSARNHGTLTVGATVGEMFRRMYRLDRKDPGYAV